MENPKINFERKPQLVIKLKNMARKIEMQLKRGEKILVIEGLSARFKIEAQTDLNRLNEEFEKEYAQEIITLLKNLGERGITVNIGAAQGFYAIYSGLAGNSTVAIEPDPLTFKSLEENIALNGLEEKISCIQSAVGDSNGEVSLFTDESRASAPSLIQGSDIAKEVKVPIFRMDEIVHDNPDVLIVDVEGYEGRVLEGMGELRPRDIFVEIHPAFLEKIGESSKSVQELLIKMGYHLKSKYQRGKELHVRYSLPTGNV